MLYVEVFIDVLLILFGLFMGICSMAGLSCSGKDKAVNDAYHLGYEMGRKAELEKIEEALRIVKEVEKECAEGEEWED